MPGQDLKDGNANPNDTVTIGRDVYENAIKFNAQLAGPGTAAISVVSKSFPVDVNIFTGVSGMVIGAIGLFGNRYYRKKGDDSGYSYMGQIMGGVQLATGMMLFALEMTKSYEILNEDMVRKAAVALSAAQTLLILMNCCMYLDGPPKAATVMSKVKTV